MRLLGMTNLGETNLREYENKGYGNSRVTNFADVGPIFVIDRESSPGSHLESPDFRWAGMRNSGRVVGGAAKISRSVTAMKRCGPA
jgi:hypothetical protein